MSTTQYIMWLALVLIGLIMAGLGGGLETGVYSLNRIRLHVLAHQGVSSAKRLAGYVAAPASLIAALLILHNCGVKLATHAAAVLLHDRHLADWQVVVFDALIMMPLLFVFAETLPKDIFAIHADRMVYPFTRPMVWLVHLCRLTGLLWLFGGVSRIVMWALGMHKTDQPFHPRRQVGFLVREGVGHGVVSDEQMAIVDRVLSLGDRSVADVMTPWKEVTTVRATDPPDVLWNLATRLPHSRFPVVDQQGNVLGTVSVFEALKRDKGQVPPIASLMKPAETFDSRTPLREGLTTLQQRRCAMAVILDRRGRHVGLVTIKDLIEPITGELAVW